MISRPPKLNDAQTILYEIDLIRYAAQKLNAANWDKKMDQWVYLEVFLLHFRNLIEFFGHPAPRADDLHITKPDKIWPDSAKMPVQNVLDKLRRPDLWDKYEAAQPDKISKYLHHCTKTRTGAKDWEVGIMYSEIEQTLRDFENALADKNRSWDVPAQIISISPTLNASTASGSHGIATIGPISSKSI
jgi:hypothetical protein